MPTRGEGVGATGATVVAGAGGVVAGGVVVGGGAVVVVGAIVDEDVVVSIVSIVVAGAEARVADSGGVGPTMNPTTTATNSTTNVAIANWPKSGQCLERFQERATGLRIYDSHTTPSPSRSRPAR